jgi:hypothetical protein
VIAGRILGSPNTENAGERWMQDVEALMQARK